MNTMELVRIVERAHPRQSTPRTPASLFLSELIGPARQAILCARQFLLSEQRDDGCWLGAQTGDVSLASQLVFLLAYQGEERSQLAQQASASVLDQQLPNGGWSLTPAGAVDVSVSVQAYFALKLTGMDAADERLFRARNGIRELGGADAADAATRYFLALLGQISYDCCRPIPPELLLASARHLPQAPLSFIWSHRPVRDVGIERGVRELFINKPSDWREAPDAKNNNRRSKPPRFVRSLLVSACRFCEQRGWTPLRRRALELAESRLLERTNSIAIRQLDFSDLVWHSIGLHAIGYSQTNFERQVCEQRLNEMVCVDEVRDRATPHFRTSPFADTLVVLRSLRVSGVPADHPAIAAVVKWLSRTRRLESPQHVVELANIVQMLCDATEDDAGTHGALPPAIEVSSDARHVMSPNKLLHRVRPLMAALAERMLEQQRRDGGWGAADVTGAVLEAIASTHCENIRPTVDRAIANLRAMQHADGSWASDSGVATIYATSQAVRSLVAAGVSHDDESIAAGLNWLAVHQQVGGGWYDSVPSTDTQTASQDSRPAPASPSHTAWALLAFVAAGQGNRLAALRAVNFLLETQRDDGTWNEPRFVLRDLATNRWFCNDLHTVAWPLLALSRWAAAAASAQPADSHEVSFRLVGAAADN